MNIETYEQMATDFLTKVQGTESDLVMFRGTVIDKEQIDPANLLIPTAKHDDPVYCYVSGHSDSSLSYMNLQDRYNYLTQELVCYTRTKLEGI